jgi:hypothetical protein
MVTVMLGVTVTMNNALYETTQRTNTAATVATVGEIMYTDLNQAVNQFSTLNSDKMVFQADTSMNLSPAIWITYDATDTYTTTEWDPVAQENKTVTLHRLYRQTGSDERVMISSNLLSVCFTYFDSDGQQIYSLGNVDAIRVKLIAKIEGVNNGITTSLNDFKANPPNLN